VSLRIKCNLWLIDLIIGISIGVKLAGFVGHIIKLPKSSPTSIGVNV
jgi:hypothetical protein